MRMFKKPLGKVAINMKPTRGAWGGSSVFVWQLKKTLERYGFKVTFRLKDKVDVIFVIDPRDSLQAKTIGLKEIKRYKKTNSQVKILHRINECDRRKGTAFMDDLLKETNELADFTVFISDWLRDYFSEQWFNTARPHKCIYNGADPAIFHPIGSSKFNPGDIMKIVTHHWSDNPMKGFPVYKLLDDMIADGIVKDTELWVIGRWPTDTHWRAARTFPPTSGHRLADLLRQCHFYITASLWEPCGMHHVEGAQCGLPLIYHEDGGGIIEAGKKYGIGFRDDLKEKLLDVHENYIELRKRVIEYMPSGDKMAFEYVRIIQQLLAL